MTTITTRQDTQDVFSWETIVTYLDENNLREAREITYDDGTFRLEIYTDGTLREARLADPGPDGALSDVKPWDTIEFYYDSTGTLEARIDQMDNGTATIREYEAGNLSRKTQYDLDPFGETSDVKIWHTIETYYDANGQREVRFELRDDGVTILNRYENGNLVSVEQTDLSAEGGPSDARIWEKRDTYYDADGQLGFRYELRDNGVTILNEYNAGQLAVQTQTDAGPTGETSSVKPWETITTFYDDAGQREAREVIYDNTDVTAMFYEDGIRSLQLQYDGDDSASWLVRAVTYDAAGAVEEVNTYDTLEDVPPEYGDLTLA